MAYSVGSWCPTPDGSGQPTAVCMQLQVGGMDRPLFLRLKTPEAVQDMVDALQKHQAHVWPDYQADE